MSFNTVEMNSKEQATLSLGSSEPGSRPTQDSNIESAMQNISGRSGIAETGFSESSQQVVSQPIHPALLHTANTDACPKVHRGFEMTKATSSSLHPAGRLPNSEFAPGEGVQQIPDDVLIAKQQAQEDFYSNAPDAGRQLSASSTASSQYPSQRVQYKSFPIQESPNLNEVNRPPPIANSMSNCSLTSTESTGSEWSLPSFPETSGSLPARSGAEPTSAIHGTDQLPWQQDPEFVVRPEEYHEKFKEGQFDCVLIYSENDEDIKMAINFKDLLQKFVLLEDGRPPSVCILDRNDNITYIQSRFKSSEEAMERSTYMFLFITKEFVSDAWAEVQKDECLMESIRQPEKKWCVVPLHTKKKKDLDFRYPYGLRALKGVDISVILPGKNLETLNVQQLSKKDIDPYFLENITRMFNQRLRHKILREKQQEVDLKKWIQEEQQRRMKCRLEREHKEKVERVKREAELKKLQEAQDQHLHKVQSDMERMELPKVGPHSVPGVGPPTSPWLTRKPPTATVDTGERVKQMLALGIPLDKILEILELEKQQSAPSPASGSGPVYHIQNYGQVQIGNQNVLKKTDGNQEHSVCDSQDSGMYEVVESSSSLNTDNSQSGQQSIRTHTSHLDSGACSHVSSPPLPVLSSPIPSVPKVAAQGQNLLGVDAGFQSQRLDSQETRSANTSSVVAGLTYDDTDDMKPMKVA